MTLYTNKKPRQNRREPAAAQEAFYNAFAEPRLFVHPSIRQVRLRIGHKFIDGIGNEIYLIRIWTMKNVCATQHLKATL